MLINPLSKAVNVSLLRARKRMCRTVKSAPSTPSALTLADVRSSQRALEVTDTQPAGAPDTDTRTE
jgi:hypothetical protein